MCHCKMLYQIATITKKVTILYLRLCPKKTDKLSAWTIVRRELSAQNGIEMEINNNNNSNNNYNFVIITGPALFTAISTFIACSYISIWWLC